MASRFSLLCVTLAGLFLGAVPAASAAELGDPREAAQEVDRLLQAEFDKTKTKVAPRTSDEDFLRRISFDLTGTVPTPQQVLLFGIDPDADKRTKAIERLLKSEEYGKNWARYWRDVVFSRSTNQRALLGRGAFQEWLEEEFQANTAWDEIATKMITATGDVREKGETGLIYAHEANAEEVAAEVSRVFLGIQIQCANCHDHPSDKWKRDDFHELAAFFPRMAVRPIREEQRLISYELVSINPRQFANRQRGRDPERVFRFLDRDRDGKLTKKEVERTQLARQFDQLLARIDTDKDGAISLKEMKNAPRPQQGRNRTGEHFMPDLDNPGSPGQKMQPVFFVGDKKLKEGANDEDRREALSNLLTSKYNPWFARAFVNRMWAEMLGQGFYMPIDDMGPERSATYPRVLALLCEGFTASKYDVKWLFRTIANTDAYQRQIRATNPAEPEAPFACATPTRLRADQLYTAILQVAGVKEQQPQGRPGQSGPYRRGRSQRDAFNIAFGFDPSTPQADITGSVPQALFLMNSPQIDALIRASGQTRLAQLLNEFPKNKNAVNELYLLVLAREPSVREKEICLKYVDESPTRGEGFEDLMWSLLNSSEFLSKR